MSHPVGEIRAVVIGYFDTAEEAGRAADKLTPTHPGTLVIREDDGHVPVGRGSWLLQAEDR